MKTHPYIPLEAKWMMVHHFLLQHRLDDLGVSLKFPKHLLRQLPILVQKRRKVDQRLRIQSFAVPYPGKHEVVKLGLGIQVLDREAFRGSVKQNMVRKRIGRHGRVVPQHSEWVRHLR